MSIANDPPCKALLIDLDGVLRRWPASDESIEIVHGLPAGAIRSLAFHPERLAAAVCGRVSDEAWRAGVADGLRVAYGAGADAAVAAWSVRTGDVDEGMLALLERHVSGVRRVLITNATSRLDRDLAALGLLDRFDAIVNSSAIGVAKPDAAFFHIALEQAGVPASLAVCVDDTAANVHAAGALGMRAHRHTDALSTERFLRSCGVLRD